MLSPEQTRLRIQETELQTLRAENKRLKARVEDFTDAFREIVISLADTLPYTYKVKLLSRLKVFDNTGE